MNDRNFRDDIKIDPLNLDMALETHPTLLFEYSEGLQDALRDLKKAELELSVLENETAIKIRSGNYERAKDQKLTEKAVGEYLGTDENIIAKQKEVLNLKYEVGVLQAGVDAFQHRKYSLTKMVDLWLSGYHGDVKVSGEEFNKHKQRKALLDSINTKEQ